MLFIYNILTQITHYLLKIIALFNPKIKLFVDGRKNVFTTLAKQIKPTDKTIWIHTASLGEFEQGLPVIEKLKTQYPSHKIIVSFFSPSGYEVKKNTPLADAVVYLPLDTKANAKRFLDAVHPDLVIFVKYEFWPNYLTELKKRNLNTLLISAIFRENQVFFKFYGKWMQRYLHAFNHFFVQNKASESLLKSVGFTNVTVSGDTRFDRVMAILQQNNHLDFVENFKQNKTTIVYGSSWEDDEAIYLDFINSTVNIKHIIAPHNIKKNHINRLKASIHKKNILFSEIKGRDLSAYDVLIIDTIGLLTKIYSYADIAYVGGAFKTGLHNVLEPAVFGVPVIIGPIFDKFQEANDLVKLGGVIPVSTKNDYQDIMSSLVNNETKTKAIGNINKMDVQQKSGATSLILNHICKNINLY